MEQQPLWAPWRVEYVSSPKTGDCIFCAAVEDRDHPLVVVRGSRCLIMLNAYPYAAGHLMVVPNRHLAELEDLDDGELGELTALTKSALAALRTLMKPAGFNVGLNLGVAAGAGFRDHLHQHVVPRWDGDTNFMPVLGGTRVISEALASTAPVLRRLLTAEREES
jgi:ATP adenylyltransferase